MKTPLLLCFASGLLLSSCGKTEPTIPVTRGVMIPVSSSDSAATATLFNQVNDYRKSLGKPALVRNEGLDKLARQHTAFMIRNRGKFKLEGKNVSHDGFEARTVVARQRYNMSTFHENVAAAPQGVSLLQSWVNSRSHELAMRSNWTDTGISVMKDSDGMMFATQLFGMKALPHTRLQDRWNSF